MDRSSTHPGRFDPEIVGQLERWLGPVVRRMWPGTLEGLEHLPEGGRFMVVANHSGMGIAELWSMIFAWNALHQGARPIAGMAHPAAFKIPPVRHFLDGLGAVEATREGAARACAAGSPLLLFPGGDHESMRPLWQARRVDWNGRRGWIRLAREHGLTIVPMCIRGSHMTLPILARSRALAWAIGGRAIGMHRAPLPALAIPAAIGALKLARAAGAPGWVGALGVVGSVWGTLALPWIPSRLTFRLLPPIAPSELGEGEAAERAVYARVVTLLERTLRAPS